MEYLALGFTTTASSGVLPAWALVVIAVGAAIISGWVFWFIKKRD